MHKGLIEMAKVQLRMSKHAGPTDGNQSWSEKTLRLIPSPLISTTKTYNRTGRNHNL